MDNSTKVPFWEFKQYGEAQWFKTLGLGLIYLAVLYFLVHATFNVSDHYDYTNLKIDYEYATLSDNQKQLINQIYFDSTQKASPVIDPIVTQALSTAGQDSLKDSSKIDTQKNKDAIQKKKDLKSNSKDLKSKKVGKKLLLCKPGSANFKLNKAIKLINNEFSNKIDTTQIHYIEDYLASATDLEATAYLGGARFQVKSYFWLTGPAVYFEIIFWSIFGVISSLLFSLGLIGKNSTTITDNPQTVFDSSEVPYQFAKILYAPLCTLVIVLGYNYFNGTNIADISSGKGVIVFAFIGGFYSSRVIALLDRLKEVVLPGNANSTSPGANSKSQTDPLKETAEIYNPQVDPPPPAPNEKDLTDDSQGETEGDPKSS